VRRRAVVIEIQNYIADKFACVWDRIRTYDQH
jgi:hypothetical protein